MIHNTNAIFRRQNLAGPLQYHINMPQVGFELGTAAVSCSPVAPRLGGVYLYESNLTGQINIVVAYVKSVCIIDFFQCLCWSGSQFENGNF